MAQSFPAERPLITLTHRTLLFRQYSHLILIVPSAKPSLWIIELHNGQDNRLTLELVDNGLKPALDTIEREWRKQWRAAQKARNLEAGRGALIIVGRKDQDKFFSNGVHIAAPFLMALIFI